MDKSIETIVANATPPGRGGIAVIRVSGPKVPALIQRLFNKQLKPRYASYVKLFDDHHEMIDEGLALFFPAPNSFTGEDVLEFHGHGGPTIVDCVIKHILTCDTRLARPGEFSERAFLNNKIDLVQAEAIADLIDATSEQAARMAVRSLQGEFSEKIHALVEKVIYLRTYIEAAIDFVEEEIDFLADQHIANLLKQIIHDLFDIETSAKQGSLLRDGISVVIAGEPNVGKSSLLNCLSGKESAIVTDIAGTTRDILREQIHIDGMPIHIIDTAGLRKSMDLVEQEGIRRAHHELTKADIILFILDASRTPIPDINQFIQTIPASATLLTVRNKIDLLSEEPSVTDSIISLSVKNNQGIDLLKNRIKEIAGMTSSEGIFSARRRHLDALRRTSDFLQNAFVKLEDRALELMAEELREAQQALGEITGEFSTEDLLGRIFSSFCVGK